MYNRATAGYCNNKHYCYYTNINTYYPSLGLPCHCTEMQLIFSFIHIKKSARFPHGAAIIGGVRLLTHPSHEDGGWNPISTDQLPVAGSAQSLQ